MTPEQFSMVIMRDARDFIDHPGRREHSQHLLRGLNMAIARMEDKHGGPKREAFPLPTNGQVHPETALGRYNRKEIGVAPKHVRDEA